MHVTTRVLIAFGLFMSATAHGADLLTLQHPQSHQVVQRVGLAQGTGFAEVRVFGTLTREVGDATWECRVVVLAEGVGRGSDWKQFTPTLADNKFEGSARVAAGGWYRLEVRCRTGDDTLAAGAVEPIGVGEVFVIAGQSYATNCNDERLTVADSQQRVVAFDSAKNSWAVANDPQPVFDGSDGGSIWPPLGDALAKELRVPIGFANVAIGGSSSAQWLPEGNMFPRLVAAGKSLETFRAVLWQQGESDVLAKNTTDGYVANVTTIRSAAAQSWGVDPPWLLAKSTHHPTVYNDPEGEGRIRSGIDELVKRPGFLAGPDTDTLKGENRGDINSRRHFSGIGQRRAAELWLASIRRELFNALDAPQLRVGVAESEK